jgi:hypothetical protein
VIVSGFPLILLLMLSCILIAFVPQRRSRGTTHAAHYEFLPTIAPVCQKTIVRALWIAYVSMTERYLRKRHVHAAFLVASTISSSGDRHGTSLLCDTDVARDFAVVA